MTKQHMPDRIWAWAFNPRNQNAHMKGGWDDAEDKKEASYLLSTPEREAARELREALEEACTSLVIAADQARDAAKTDDRWSGVDEKLMRYAREGQAAIRKAKGEAE